MYTLKELFQGMAVIDETQLLTVSDKLWALGTLEDIKQNTTAELFYQHIAVNTIGNWKAGGWWYIFCEQANLVPYIPEALERCHLQQLKDAFERVIALFPEFTVFKQDDATYYDICNFLQSVSIKVENERLNQIDKEQRRELVKQVRNRVNQLDELTESVWGECAPESGWKVILEYISESMLEEDNVLKDSDIESEQEWCWCLVGNIVDAHEYGEQHEIKHGTKHFAPGAKVFINMVYGGFGHEKILVIGVPRHQRNYIEVVIPRIYVENFRIQKVFKPAVLKRIENSTYSWWGKTDDDRDDIIKFLDWLNPKEAENARQKYVE